MINKIFHKGHDLHLSHDALDGIICAICDTISPTRKSIASTSNYSEVTVGKVFEGMYASNLARKEIKKPNDSARACAHLRFNEDVRLLVIDISTRNFYMALFNMSLEPVYIFSYTYADTVRLEDNLLSFFSCGVQALEGYGRYFSACVLIKENDACPCSHAAYPHLPPAKARAFSPESTVKDFFGYAPDLVLTPDTAVREYLYRESKCEDTAYIFIGSELAMYHLSKDRRLTVFSPWNIIIGDMPLWKYLSSSTDTKTYYTSVAKLINTLECTFPVKNILIQSDSLCLGNAFIKEIKEYIEGIYRTDVNITPLPSPYPIHLIGSASLARKLLLENTLISAK